MLMTQRPRLMQVLLGSLALASAAACNHVEGDGHPATADGAGGEMKVTWTNLRPDARSVAISLADGLGEIDRAACLLLDVGSEPTLVWTQLPGTAFALNAGVFASDDCSGIPLVAAIPLIVPAEVGARTVVGLELGTQQITAAIGSSFVDGDDEAEAVFAAARCKKDGDCGHCQRCASGRCQNQASGQDSKHECAASTCETGKCDGKGQCAHRNDAHACGTNKVCRGGACTSTCSAGACGPCRMCGTSGQCVAMPDGSACAGGGICRAARCQQLCASTTCGPCQTCSATEARCIPKPDGSACQVGGICRNGLCAVP
jgi:hypothetical protein